jgi:hypothetical protein
MARWPNLLAAALLALPAPAAAQDGRSSPDEQVLDLYAALCVRNTGAPAGFVPVEWSSVPAELRLLNTYGHAGTFLRGEADGRILYAARTTGPGQDSIAAGEHRCGAAVRGADLDRVARMLTRRFRARAMPMNLGPIRATLFQSEQGVISLSEADDGWIIVRAYDVTFR